MFGGTSPVSTPTFQNHFNDIQDIDGIRTTRLYDQSDLYVFDFGKKKKNLIIFYCQMILIFFFFSSNFKNIMFTLSCPTKN